MDTGLIKEMQEKEAEMLRVFIEICEKLKLQYYVIGGTLIGTIRHHGFIPWDDDIDVDMMREDYETFIKEAPKLLPKNMFLQTPDTDPDSVFPFAKLRNSETTFIEKRFENIKMNHGLWIDIFPLDYYPESKTAQRKLSFRKKYIEAAFIKILGADEGTRKNKIFALFRKAIAGCSYRQAKTICGINKRRIRLFRSVKQSELVINYSGAYSYEKEAFRKEWFSSSVEMDFCGLKVSVPIGYDAILKQVYGNYMELPPENQRTPRHDACIIDMKKPYTEYQKKLN